MCVSWFNIWSKGNGRLKFSSSQKNVLWKWTSGFLWLLNCNDFMLNMLSWQLRRHQPLNSAEHSWDHLSYISLLTIKGSSAISSCWWPLCNPIDLKLYSYVLVHNCWLQNRPPLTPVYVHWHQWVILCVCKTLCSLTHSKLLDHICMSHLLLALGQHTKDTLDTLKTNI